MASPSAGRRHRYRCRLRHRPQVDAGRAARRTSAFARRRRRGARRRQGESEVGDQCHLSRCQPRRDSFAGPIAGFRLFACCSPSRARHPCRNCGDCDQTSAGRAIFFSTCITRLIMPAWYPAPWRISNHARPIISRLRHPRRLVFGQTTAALIYWPLARSARLLVRFGLEPQHMPLAYYADKSFYVKRTDI